MSRSLHRRLAHRLIFGSLAVAVFCGGLTFFIEMEKVDSAVLSLATTEAEAFAAEFPGPLKSEHSGAIETRLNNLLHDHKGSVQGHFLMAEVYSEDRDDIAQASDNLPPVIQRKIETGTHRFPKDGEPWYRKILLGDELYLQVVTPLFLPDGTRRGFFEGVYDVPPARLAEIRGRVTYSVFEVVLVTLLTAVTLYPLIRGLQKEQEKLSHGLVHANLGTLAVLGSAIAKRDSDTHAHNFRVALYALGLAEALKLQPEEMRELLKGAWLHDVGKIAISDTILLKPGKLDDDEFSIMKTHVRHGLDIVHHCEWLEDAARVVGGHHEKWDGSGYPSGLRGGDIPLSARIFALADVFDALTSRRPYKQALSMDEALAIMAEGRGRHFDPTLFDLFLTIVPGLYGEFGGREDDTARRLLEKRGYIYFFDQV